MVIFTNLGVKIQSIMDHANHSHIFHLVLLGIWWNRVSIERMPIYIEEGMIWWGVTDAGQRVQQNIGLLSLSKV